ncbi:hypothetical protein CaCOL14_001602 [Colletotrichum acutatum]|uniref:Uncharacterized protein n=1 Tax=Glomerella acutata TaxID=27357 RepID=A0AAD8UJU9_GLOAC|nr:uncharacterized protein BDZ83DRAFT_627877 [Colletotrichum acutatum]KAK1722858.1 hypothetical protein BDZ83DRAFT_627877 [Colletotrichum acutatum]
MMFLHSLIVGVFAIAVTAAPAPTPQGDPAQDRCAGVACPENSYCKVFDFRLEHPVGCQSNGTVPADAETCGSVICPTGTTCCNSPCGVCAKPGETCLQWVC